MSSKHGRATLNYFTPGPQRLIVKAGHMFDIEKITVEYLGTVCARITAYGTSLIELNDEMVDMSDALEIVWRDSGRYEWAQHGCLPLPPPVEDIVAALVDRGGQAMTVAESQAF